MEEDEIINRLIQHPETCRTLLKSDYGRNSKTIITKRKISRNIKQGIIGRVYLNGTRGGEVLLYHCDKNYRIIISFDHRDFRYYCCVKFKKLNNSEIELEDAKELIDAEWKEINNIKIMIVNLIKVI